MVGFDFRAAAAEPCEGDDVDAAGCGAEEVDAAAASVWA
jgi:hypothetical protein